ncbi:MAG: 16S rRNA (guanine(527)-N(7))-methyltransferase RsmG [Pseudomonadota bacterium]
MLAEQLRRGLDAMGLALDSGCQERLLAYLALLSRWNRRYNLTAVREPEAMVTRHLLDSLSLLPFLREGSLIDVGSGAGLPGVPIALVQPWREVTVLDSNGKKTRFLDHLKLTLEIPRLSVVKARCEDYRPERPFDLLTSRAFAALGDMIAGCQHLLAPGGEYLAMKGMHPQEEIDDLPSSVRLLAVDPVEVPGLDEARCIVRMSPC